MAEGNRHDELARLLMNCGCAVLKNEPKKAELLIQTSWPHEPRKPTKRSASDSRKLMVWLKDGFRCRYCGDLLFFPPYMTVLSTLFPITFPAHRHGKSELAHDAYWTHFASLEHVEPTSTGGTDLEDNWITTSMARNQVRSRYPIEVLGWSIKPREPLPDWDGGVGQFMSIVDQHPELRAHEAWGKYISRWERTVRRVTLEYD